MPECDIISTIVVGVLSGIISSLIVWVLLNIFTIPRVQIDNEIQYGKRRNYLRIYNKSWINIFEVVCYVEYLYSDGSSFFRMDNPVPTIRKRTGKYIINLGRNINTTENPKNFSKTDYFFNQKEGTIVVTITYQNRFGVKRALQPKNIEYIKESQENFT